MAFRSCIEYVGMGMLLLTLSSARAAKQQAPNSAPHILFILADDLGFGKPKSLSLTTLILTHAPYSFIFCPLSLSLARALSLSLSLLFSQLCQAI